MRTSPSIKPYRAAIRFAALALLVLTSTSSARAQSARIIARPLPPSDIATYKLPTTTQKSGGLMTVGIGEPVYLEAQVVKGTPATGITWALTAQPTDSTATLNNSPLGTDIPSYEPSERLEFDIAGRKLLVPDKTGQYTLTATVSSTTNIVLTATVTAGTYVGAGLIDGNNVAAGRQCGSCHDGGLTPDKLTTWSKTKHAHMLTGALEGVASDHYGPNCISCHTVGYDTAATAVNGGFDDVMKQLNWSFPTNLTTGTWDTVPAALKHVANIQCENCHGPGSEHRGAKAKTSVSFSVGACATCHASGTHHIRPQEWANSKHAISVREERTGCADCHSGIGFIDKVGGAATVRLDYAPITCVTCHDPHSVDSPHQLRAQGSVKLNDTSKAGGATEVTTAGKGAICMNCHKARRDAETYTTTANVTRHFGPHYGPQADMLMGVNAITYGKVIPSSGHGLLVTDTCVTCHMQTVAPTNAAFLKAGSHTFNLTAHNTTNGTVHLVEACQGCHGPSVTSFDIARVDYDGNGAVEGVQTEVKGLIRQLSLLLPPLGVPKITHAEISSALSTNYTIAERKAVYNLQFVMEDGSFGVHNTAYAVGLLKASIADLGGGSTPGGSITDVNNAIANYFANSTNYLTNPVSLGQGMFQLGVDNLVGWNLGVQASSDLQTWTNLPTAALPVYQFNDPDAANAQKRFYRFKLR